MDNNQLNTEQIVIDINLRIDRIMARLDSVDKKINEMTDKINNISSKNNNNTIADTDWVSRWEITGPR